MPGARMAVLMAAVSVVPGMLLSEVPVGQAATAPVVVSSPAPMRGVDSATPGLAGNSLTVESFNNYDPVTGNGRVPAELVIPVSGMPSTITDLSVYLRGLDAYELHGVWITIVTPDGTAVDLIEDACQGSTADVSGKDFIVDDRGTAPLPRSTPETTDACWRDRDMIQVSNYSLAFPSEPTQLAALNGHPANGDWKIRVRSNDGNNAGLSSGFGFILAADDPDTAITSGPVSGGQSGSSVSFGFGSPNFPGATFDCSLDAAPFSACVSPQVLNLRAGSRTFEVRARSLGG